MSSAGVVAISPIHDESIFGPHIHSRESTESIVIYVAVPGSMVPMRILATDSIESVKLKIQTYKGFVVRNQKLVCGGRELARSNSLVKEYGVSDGDVLHLLISLSNLQVITVKTSCGYKFTLHVDRSRDVGYVKRQVARKKKSFDDVGDQEVLCDGQMIDDQKLITDICKNKDAVLYLYVRKSAKIRVRPVAKEYELSITTSESTSESKDDLEPVIESNGIHGDILLKPIILNQKIKLPSVICDMIDQTFDGLDQGNSPIRSTEGTGGTYFMLDNTGKKYLSVFKPIDEEPMAVNNPRGLPLSENGEGLKKGTRVGQGAYREVAAYILDHPKSGRRSFSGEEKGFSGVPPTTMVKCLHRDFYHPNGLKQKIGSLQRFMENFGSCEDVGPGSFPVEEVHKISVLDIRMANADRHAGNILVGKSEDGRTALIPIDHGYCLPETFEDCTFEWLYWPQAKQPYNAETIEYINSLDADEDIALLNHYGWDLQLECARILRISTMLLKKGAQKGLTPFEIGSIMCRQTLNKESLIEEIFQQALDSVLPETSESSLLDSVSAIMDRHLDDMARKK
jgi:hypothetical protein